MTETIFEKNECNVYFDGFFSLAHDLTWKGRGYTAARHQGVIEMFWLHFWVAVMTAVQIDVKIASPCPTPQMNRK